MTKADRIRELTEKCPQLDSVQIGQRLGCSDAYVRAVWQRIRGGGYSAADRNYALKVTGSPDIHPRTWRYQNDPEFRKRVKKRQASNYRRKKREAAA